MMNYVVLLWSVLFVPSLGCAEDAVSPALENALATEIRRAEELGLMTTGYDGFSGYDYFPVTEPMAKILATAPVDEVTRILKQLIPSGTDRQSQLRAFYIGLCLDAVRKRRSDDVAKNYTLDYRDGVLTWRIPWVEVPRATQDSPTSAPRQRGGTPVENREAHSQSCARRRAPHA